jgi:hypothetical protein
VGIANFSDCQVYQQRLECRDFGAVLNQQRLAGSEEFMRNSLAIAVVLASVVFFGTISAQDGPDSVIRGTKRFQKRVLVSGLEGPWNSPGGPIICSG